MIYGTGSTRLCTVQDQSAQLPLIRPSVRTGAPSPEGEGFGTAPEVQREGFEVGSGDTPLPMRLQSLLGGLSQSGEADIQENQLLAGVL